MSDSGPIHGQVHGPADSPDQRSSSLGRVCVPAPSAREQELLEEIRRLCAANQAQAQVITTLVNATEGRQQELSSRLGTQHAVEQRTARLHDGERVLRSVIESLDGALCIVGIDGVVLDANRRWPVPVGSNFLDWCRETPDLHYLLRDVAGIVERLLATAPEALSDQSSSVKGQIGPDGARRWVMLRVHPVREHHRARAVVTLIDITDGMRTQDDLRRAMEEARRLALVARATDNAVAVTDADGLIEWANDSFLTATHCYGIDDVRGRRRADLLDPACLESEEVQDFLARVEQGMPADGEFQLVTRGGDPYWASLEVRPVREQGRISHLVWIEQDITARRDTQRRLRQATNDAEQLAEALSQEKTLLSGVISAIPQLVYWKDRDGRYAGCNTAYVAFRGLQHATDLVGRDEVSLARSDVIGTVLEGLEVQVMNSGSAVLDHKADVADSEGNVRSLLLSVLPLDLAGEAGGSRGVIGVGADITPAREMERQLAQANRLESIGQLASGIAHEINTPIQFVTDNTQFVYDSTNDILRTLREMHTILGAGSGPDAAGWRRAAGLLEALDLDFLCTEVPGALQDNREGLHRVAEIVRAMKDYAHPGVSRGDVDVNRAIESTVHVCRNEWKYVAEVVLDLDPDAGLVPAYEGDLKQVVLNMVVNAAQAIADDPSRAAGSGLGRITISTRRAPGEFLVMIADDGPGMTDAVRERVFNPFFTTKQVGKGTGQGLSLAHAVIVTKHQGRIELQTAPGQGATFTLHLPLADPDPAVSEPTGAHGQTPVRDPVQARSQEAAP